MKRGLWPWRYLTRKGGRFPGLNQLLNAGRVDKREGTPCGPLPLQEEEAPPAGPLMPSPGWARAPDLSFNMGRFVFFAWTGIEGELGMPSGQTVHLTKEHLAAVKEWIEANSFPNAVAAWLSDGKGLAVNMDLIDGFETPAPTFVVLHGGVMSRTVRDQMAYQVLAWVEGNG